MLNIVIPMAGAGSRFKTEGYDLPKPFIDVNGKMMIEHVLESLQVEDAFYTLIIQEQFKQDNKEQLELLRKNYNVVFATVEKLTQGASCTALSVHELVNNNFPVIFADADNIFDNKVIKAFIKDALIRDIDGSLLTFNTDKDCYSFVEIDENGNALRTREKEVISNHAITGVYMFKRGRDFVKCAINMMIYGDKAKNEYYMSNVYNHAIKYGLKIGVFDIGKDDWACVGTPAQLKEYLAK
ncbi:MAG: 2-C-methyl-D-erythritol 4-phosphate cytidylyltransferase [Alphaproteobacteria bacterium ADurb.Bin438]|nr:MAG: 2-C-methyl-D-erythritol 4-phosphate cytidylyltransferase [Alphaproteobacteria bacterium ADurb.Bin438]